MSPPKAMVWPSWATAWVDTVRLVKLGDCMPEVLVAGGTSLLISWLICRDTRPVLVMRGVTVSIIPVSTLLTVLVNKLLPESCPP